MKLAVLPHNSEKSAVLHKDSFLENAVNLKRFQPEPAHQLICFSHMKETWGFVSPYHGR